MDEEFKMPLSSEELNEVKSTLYERISFLEVMQKYASNIIDCWHSDFTNKCSCPIHSNGKERTPSFYFSEVSKTYKCFACNAGGDVFDIIGMMEGRPWFQVVQDAFDKANIDPNNIDMSGLTARPKHTNIITNIDLELSSKLREHLYSLKETEFYEGEKKWVDWQYRRIDERLSKLNDTEQGQGTSFKIRIMNELERRQLATNKGDNRNW